jgi:hypothetical protein
MNRKSNGKYTLFLSFLNIPLRILSLFFKSINKVYGNKYFESKHSSINNQNYQLFSVNDFINELKGI